MALENKMYYIFIAAVLLMINNASSTNETIRSELLALGLSPGSQIGLTSGYTPRWSSYEAPSYVIAVKPDTEDDVAKIVILPIRVCLFSDEPY